MRTQAPLEDLLRHLELAPHSPVPEPLRAAVVTVLRRSKTERDRILNAAAEAMDPHRQLKRWGRAQRLAEHIRHFMRPENRARTGRRQPTNEVERLLILADRCGCGLPTSSRRCWDALWPVDDTPSRRPGLE